MNEELQSTNDELQTINDELRDRTQELNDTNAFTESILRGLRGAVIVVDHDLVVRIWNQRAEEFWGLRPEEAIGQNLLGLDIGLPTQQLKPLVRKVMNGGDGEAAEIKLDAVNRRGRTLAVRVVGSALHFQADATGAILVIDEI